MRIFTLLFAFLLAASFSFGQNLITNGDFENGMPGDPVPDWGGFKNRILNDTTVGSQVGQIENGDGSLFQEFGVTPGERYDLRLKYRWVNSGANNTNLVMRIKDADNLPTNLVLIGGTTPNSDGYKLETTVDQWFEGSFSFVPPTGIDTVRLLMYKANGNKSLNVDSVSVTLFVPCVNPTADFSVSSTNGREVTFSNQSSGTELAYSWDFGDGNTSMMAAPTHTYAADGRFEVCLQATDTCGVSVSTCDSIDVAACATASADFDYAATNLEVTFTNQSSGTELSYAWDFGDGNTSTDEAPVHEYDTTGTYEVCLQATDSCGTSVSFCDSVTVSASTSLTADFPYELSIYPNPANEFVYVSTTHKMDRVELYNMHGQLLRSKTTQDSQVQLNVSGLTQGIYLVKVYVDDATGTYRLIKR